MSLPSGLLEELTLERLALAELEASGLVHYQAGHFALWAQDKQEAQACRQHIAELEALLEAQP